MKAQNACIYGVCVCVCVCVCMYVCMFLFFILVRELSLVQIPCTTQKINKAAMGIKHEGGRLVPTHGMIAGIESRDSLALSVAFEQGVRQETGGFNSFVALKKFLDSFVFFFPREIIDLIISCRRN